MKGSITKLVTIHYSGKEEKLRAQEAFEVIESMSDTIVDMPLSDYLAKIKRLHLNTEIKLDKEIWKDD